MSKEFGVNDTYSVHSTRANRLNPIDGSSCLRHSSGSAPLIIEGDYTECRSHETWHDYAPKIYKLWKAVENDGEKIAFGAQCDRRGLKRWL